MARSVAGARLAKVGVSFVEVERMLNICRHMQIIFDIVRAQSYVFYRPWLTSSDRTCMVSFFYVHPELTTDVAPFRFFLQGLSSGFIYSFLWLNLLSC